MFLECLLSPHSFAKMIPPEEIRRKAPPPWLGPPPSRPQLDGQLLPPPPPTKTLHVVHTAAADAKAATAQTQVGIQHTWSALLPPMPQRPPPRPRTLALACPPRAKPFSGRQRTGPQQAQVWIPTLPSTPEHSQVTDPQPPPPLPPPSPPPLPPPPTP